LLVVMQRSIWKLAAGLVVMAGCGGAAAPRLTVPDPAVSGATAARACGRWVVGASAAVAEQRVLALAGGFGTEEAPRFVGELVCQLGERRPVVLVVPWPRQLASTLNLALGGSTGAEAKLRESGLWTHAPLRQRGLATAAMMQLVERLEGWRAAGLEVRLVPVGAELPDPESGYEPDETSERYYQAHAIGQAIRKHPDAAVVLWLPLEEGDRDTLKGALGEVDTGLLTFRLEEPGANAAPTPTPTAAAKATAAPATAAPTTSTTTVAPAEAAPWSLERRKDVGAYDGVFRLGGTSTSRYFVESSNLVGSDKR
jgi:hypothetical protein